MNGETNTRADRFVRALKDHRLVSMVIIFGVVVIALGQFTGALDALRKFFRPEPPAALTMEYCLLLSPLAVQFDRTKDAFARWNEPNAALEKQTVRDGNLKARTLLEKYSQLVPDELQKDRQKLVQHYDRWLEEYQRLREGPDTGAAEPFVYVGPKGYPFPSEAEGRFRARLERVRRQLDGQAACPAIAGN